jgi:hypothetical protein
MGQQLGQKEQFPSVRCLHWSYLKWKEKRRKWSWSIISLCQ